jgi:hypothetical protein
MDHQTKEDLALTLSKFSALLIQEKLINPETDQTALIEAVGNVAHTLNQPSPAAKPVLSSLEFIKGPLANLLAKHERSQQKIEELRKQKFIDEMALLQNKPSINSNSKKFAPTMPPLHTRTEKIIKEKNRKMESEQKSKEKKEEDEFVKNCTFRPHSRSNSRSRSPESVTKELYKWSEVKNKGIERKRKEKEEQEKRLVVEKPKIDRLSERLSRTVNYK